MDKQQSIQYLIRSLLQDMPSLRKEADGFPPDPASQRRLLRSLMNLRPPMPLQQDFLRVQDALLCAERAEKGVVEEVALPVCAADPHLADEIRVACQRIRILREFCFEETFGQHMAERTPHIAPMLLKLLPKSRTK